MQIGIFFDELTEHQIALPTANEFVLPGLRWGAIEEFPAPAYWAFQVLARKASEKTIRNRIGDTLCEEVCACLLGSHGVPSAVALAAFRHLKNQGLLAEIPTAADVLEELSKPLEIEGRTVRYRFARQKSTYIAFALARLAKETPPEHDGRIMRMWLTTLPGIGLKIGSWITRNWLNSNDVAIIDIHVFRAGLLAGFFERDLSIQRNYLELEEQFLRFSRALGTSPAELDAVIWHDMSSSPKTVRSLLEARKFQNYSSTSLS